ncbi:MAG: hypothetical protein US68_C0006G0072 [Candidatus Shapirobacteria bacterium GW2011_GWE1_38_10]|uniref:Uncharacterized protein n=1 Tax=Candidatus Shapirobacteria bacterium GW2011_GWE1_38_10 TaxID=1618488 RepID=A0A0G0I763_9BACT|nr:MAG: hypothetical protein US46_C0002G0107 [Candidatus Shapirobacteria bacterium GW2011_GWF2_37_20]KKQ50392.1 MAG: hypothetical protein US68_C0006G0072 [Candidatus Shapirobacteria bacterium GW2011_GWE1_38_10]KKQ65216.1 MAG: hypothetical protein US85_C0001G0143 [Candidatus Shapirobacteria bacterium GW2011_GWF1_38_23]HBP51207.1 hypothetical protein [Candidatus Shapirobacteria bacterium]
MSPVRVEQGVLDAEKFFIPMDFEKTFNAGQDIFVRESRWGYPEEDDKGAYIIANDRVKLVEFIDNVSTYRAVEGLISIPLGKQIVVGEKPNKDHGWRVVRMTFVK